MRFHGRVRGVMATVLALLACATAGDYSRPAQARQIVLWAWERPEELRFTEPASTGVAFLASTARLYRNQTLVRHRAHPLTIPPGAPLTAVVRIEVDRGAALSIEQRRGIVEVVLRCARLESVTAVQIDFDARQSERSFYRTLLTDLRRALPESMRLSITALASWCLDDAWIRDLPIDEAVPMLFRMGPEGRAIRERIARGEPFRVAACQDSAGVALDEARVSVAAVRRLYVFSPAPWTRDSVRIALGMATD
jgi:hypothetical protein